MRRLLMLLVLATLVTVTAACKSKTADEASVDVAVPTIEVPAVVEPTTEPAPLEVQGDLTMPSAPAPVAEYTKLDSGLEYAILKEGEGVEAALGDAVQVHYTGWLEDGTMFDSSLKPGSSGPLPFTLGSSQVIPGWELGVLGMKVGEQRQLKIPAALAYGESGSGPIPPNATLIFDVQLVGIQ
jgi:peptidylprolyl isomerase